MVPYGIRYKMSYKAERLVVKIKEGTNTSVYRDQLVLGVEWVYIHIHMAPGRILGAISK